MIHTKYLHPRFLLSESLILMIKCYRLLISPLLGPVCRFHPSCSNYMVESIRKHGAFKGVLRGLGRLSRCHPWNPGGYDPP